MTEPASGIELTREQRLILQIARRPRICCCCLCLQKHDRRRARRIFRLTRKVTRAWDKERENLHTVSESENQDPPWYMRR